MTFPISESYHFSSPTETRMCGLVDCCKPLCKICPRSGKSSQVFAASAKPFKTTTGPIPRSMSVKNRTAPDKNCTNGSPRHAKKILYQTQHGNLRLVSEIRIPMLLWLSKFNNMTETFISHFDNFKDNQQQCRSAGSNTLTHVDSSCKFPIIRTQAVHQELQPKFYLLNTFFQSFC